MTKQVSEDPAQPPKRGPVNIEKPPEKESNLAFDQDPEFGWSFTEWLADLFLGKERELWPISSRPFSTVVSIEKEKSFRNR